MDAKQFYSRQKKHLYCHGGVHRYRFSRFHQILKVVKRKSCVACYCGPLSDLNYFAGVIYFKFPLFEVRAGEDVSFGSSA